MVSTLITTENLILIADFQNSDLKNTALVTSGIVGGVWNEQDLSAIPAEVSCHLDN